MMLNFAADIKERVSMFDVCQLVGIKPDRHGFARCVFHQEKTASMKIYRDGYKCYGCGDAGDVITFYRHFYGLTFQSACQRINADFHLGLPLDDEVSLREIRAAQEESRARVAAIRADRAEREWLERDHEAALGEYIKWSNLAALYAPDDPDRAVSGLYAEAVKKLPALEERLTETETRLLAYEAERNRNQ